MVSVAGNQVRIYEGGLSKVLEVGLVVEKGLCRFFQRSYVRKFCMQVTVEQPRIDCLNM